MGIYSSLGNALYQAGKAYIMAHPLASLIPDSNRIEIARSVGRCSVAAIMKSLYLPKNQGGGGFIGSFTDKDEQPDWARRIARWNREDFRQNTPGTKKLFSDIASSLASGEGLSMPNFRYALDKWDGKGDKPFTRYQQFGDCVDSSSTEHEECLFGYRAAKMPEVNEQFKYACTYGRYAERGYCGDGWNGSGIAAVALRTGAFFARVVSDGTNTLDMTDEMKTESLMARTYCRSGLPQWLKTYVHKNHPYEDGAITEFDGDIAGMRSVFASGGVLQTGGTNTSGSSRPFVIGPVGGHEQSFLGCDDSEEAKKFFTDKGFRIPAGDFPCIASQTWGPGWSDEVSNQYWPVGTNEQGQVFTQADINQMRSAGDSSVAETLVASLAGSWGWGEKPEGAWIFLASQVLRCFGGDIFAWLPRVKGFPSDGPAPLPPPAAFPTISGQLFAEPFEGGIAIRGEVHLEQGSGFPYIAVPDGSGKYKLIPKPTL